MISVFFKMAVAKTSTRAGALDFCLILALVAVSLFASPVLADEIESFDVKMRAFKDSSFQVQERIFVRFDEARHGIFRDLPIIYTRYNANYTVDFHLDSVKDERGGAIPFKVSRSGRYVTLKIGSPDLEITGEHLYVLTYTLRRAVNFFSGKPEIYWNVTGDNWPYQIRHAGLELILPEGTSAFDCQTASFKGVAGSSESGGRVARPGRQSIYYECGQLAPGEGFTVVAGLPAGAMVEPGLGQLLLWYLQDWWPVILIPAFGLAGLYATWRHLGRDAEATGPIAVEWNPPGELTPAEVGTLIDERCDLKDVLASILDLAARGYLTIKEVKTPGLFGSGRTYSFIRQFALEPVGPTSATSQFKHSLQDPQLKPFERKLLQAIFDVDNCGNLDSIVSLEDLREKFYLYIPVLQKMIYEDLSQRGLFVDNPEQVRGTYRAVGFAICLIGLIGLCGGFGMAASPVYFGITLSGLLFFFFAEIMPARTLNGVRLRRQALGFALFARKAEKRRIEVLAKDDPTIFGRLLPYAIVLAAADSWAHAFDGLAVEPPDWYQSSDPHYHFSTRTFVSDMGSSMNSMQMALPSSPSSSAGSGSSGFSSGSSGGGYGGGGGGSW